MQQINAKVQNIKTAFIWTRTHKSIFKSSGKQRKKHNTLQNRVSDRVLSVESIIATSFDSTNINRRRKEYKIKMPSKVYKIQLKVKMFENMCTRIQTENFTEK